MQETSPGDRRLRTGNYGGIKFSEGWFFFHVAETEYIELKPYVLSNENDVSGEIAPSTAGSEDSIIEDTLNRRLAEPGDDEKNLLFQVLVGIAPSRMQLYPMFGRDRSPNLEGGAEPGDPQTPITGYDSPYNNPAEYFQFLTFNDQSKLNLQAFNPMRESAEARISVHVNKMKYLAVEDDDLMAGFIQGQVPFKDFSTAMAAQNNDQARVPEWMNSRFGDLIKSTQQILEDVEEEEEEGRLPSPSTPRNGGEQ